MRGVRVSVGTAAAASDPSSREARRAEERLFSHVSSFSYVVKRDDGLLKGIGSAIPFLPTPTSRNKERRLQDPLVRIEVAASPPSFSASQDSGEGAKKIAGRVILFFFPCSAFSLSFFFLVLCGLSPLFFACMCSNCTQTLRVSNGERPDVSRPMMES